MTPTFRSVLGRFVDLLVSFALVLAVAGPLSADVRSGEKRALQSYGEIPLAFEPNLGQASKDVRFLTRSQGLTALFKDREADLAVSSLTGNQKGGRQNLRVLFLGANPSAAPSGLGQQAGISNYLLGDNSSRWQVNIPHFDQVEYSDLYPGIDLVFYGNPERLEHDFIVSPGADYRQIRVRLAGATKLELASDGSLVVTTSSGTIKFRSPDIYQSVRGKRSSVRGTFAVLAADEFGFAIDSYDKAIPLVIDPVLTYSTYLAGTNTDLGLALAVDSAGNAYVTGYTYSLDFPVLNAEQGTCAAACSQADVFVTKFNPAGSALVYSTYVGGSNFDQANAIAVDSIGNAFVSGFTSSIDFPQKNGIPVVLTSYNNHGFAFSLNAVGSAFNFSTYLGGIGTDSATGIAVDASSNAYISGWTGSSNFPVTPGNQIGPVPGTYGSDIFVTKITSTGSLLYSTALGGNSTDYYNGTFGYQPSTPISVAVDSQGQALLAGAAFYGFPTTPGSYQANYPNIYGSTNAFLCLLNGSGTALVYGTYLGGTGAIGGDSSSQAKMDGSGNVYITGIAGSLDFPTTAGAFQTTNVEGNTVSFISKLDPTLSTLLYSTYLGGTKNEYGNGVKTAGLALDASGNAYVVGNTSQASFPLVNPLQTTIPQNFYGSANTAFLSVLNSSGSALTFSSFFSGSVGTSGAGVALDISGNPLITGTTSDPDLPTTPGSFQPTIPVPQYPVGHAFLTKFALNTPNAGACLSTSTLAFGIVELGKSSFPLTLTVTNCGTLTLKLTNTTISNPVFALVRNGCRNVAPGASCSITLKYTPTQPNFSDTGTLQLTDNSPINPQTVQLSGYSAVASILLYTTELDAPDELVGLTSAPVLTTIQTYGSVPLHITSVTATGDFAGVNDCPKALQPGQSCSLGATFTPTASGTRTGTLSIYDDVPGSPQTVTLVGNGLTSYPVPVITSLSPGSAQVGAAPFTLAIFGAEIFPTSTVMINGKTVPSKPGGSPDEVLVTIGSNLLKQVGNLAVQVVNPAPGGGVSAPFGFSIYSQTTLGAADVAYEPFTQKFYASIPSNSLTNPNSLVTVDPFTGVVGPPIPIGNNPGALGISSDGITLYVGLNGDNTIVPFNLLTQTAGTPIPLGSDAVKGPLTASSIAVQPNNSANLIATLNSSFYGADGIELIENGTVVSQYLNEPPVNISLGGARFVTPAQIYGWSNNYSAYGLLQFLVTGKGLLEAPGISGTYTTGAFDSDGKSLYDVNGQVFDAATGALIGTISSLSGFAAYGVLDDSSTNRVFFYQNGTGILAVDGTTLAQVGSVYNYLIFTTTRMQHWGPDGLSLLNYNYGTSGYDLILLKTDLFYPAVGPNPVPTGKTLTPSSVTSQGPNFVLTVSGSNFVAGAVVQWNGANRTTKYVSSSKLTADIPASDIAASGTAKVTVLNPLPGGGKSGPLLFTIK